jgi:membrane-bound metal-dependent hydrolase YbcI (DUF457 family)
MFMGHFSAALVSKRIAPGLPLWVLLLAAQAVDALWALFVLSGIERASLDTTLPSNPLVLSYMPYTHSLSAALFWMFVVALLTLWVLRRSNPAAAKTMAAAMALAVGSHWLLDLLVHRSDLGLWGDHAKVGLALWNHPLPALLLELGLIAAAAAWLAPTLAPRARQRLWAVSAGLIVVQLINHVVPAPPTLPLLTLGMLLVFAAVVSAGAWLER